MSTVSNSTAPAPTLGGAHPASAAAGPNALSSPFGKELPAGIYAPVITIWRDTPGQEIDEQANDEFLYRLAKAGLDGVAVQGSTGEAVAMNREERKVMIRLAVAAFQRAGNPGAIIAGTVGAQSTREAIELSVDAAEAGAHFTLVLPPSYFPAAMTEAALQQYFEDVASASPIPLLIYSYPAASAGINMSTDLLLRLARHPNISGIKHTDHDIGKMAREAAAVHTLGSPFTVLGGASDYLLGALAVGAKGAITGTANICPRATAKVYELAVTGRQAEALELAGKLSTAEFALLKTGIPGTKWAVAHFLGLPGAAGNMRKPILPISTETQEYAKKVFGPLYEVEKVLEAEGYTGLGIRGGTKGALAARQGVPHDAGHHTDAAGHAKSDGQQSFLEKVKAKVANI